MIAAEKKLIAVYKNINALFRSFQYGGTYFGHQSDRILGYAEYSVYVYAQNKDNMQKTYPITKQKELYINSLRQLIKDEVSIDTYADNKAQRIDELNLIVDEIDNQITNIFYLRQAQEFQYDNYQYY